MNDQLDEGEDVQVVLRHDAQEDDEVENEAANEFENEEVVFFEVPEDVLNRPALNQPDPEIENQEENIELENAEVENGANANEIQMEPVNVDQPDDNQNDLFNEVNNLSCKQLKDPRLKITIQNFSNFILGRKSRTSGAVESRRTNMGANAWARWFVRVFRTCILGCFVEYTFHFIIRVFSTSDGQSFCQKENAHNSIIIRILCSHTKGLLGILIVVVIS